MVQLTAENEEGQDVTHTILSMRVGGAEQVMRVGGAEQVAEGGWG